MKTLVFLLEERSAAVFLEGFLPRAFPAIADRNRFAPPVYITFSGKYDMRKQLAGKLRKWRTPDSSFIVLQDQDMKDCREEKERLTHICSAPGMPHKNTKIRIVCRQLENWYLGDLTAVENAFGIPGLVRRNANTSRFRKVDALSGEEELRKITGKRYEKIDGSRRMGAKMNVHYLKNASRSFQAFCRHIDYLTGGESGGVRD